MFDPGSTDCVNDVKPLKEECCSDPTCRANIHRSNSVSSTILENDNFSDDFATNEFNSNLDCESGCCHSRVVDEKDFEQERVPGQKDKDELGDYNIESSNCFAFRSTSEGNAQTSKRELRSMFHCNAICCKSEIPIIKTVLEPIGGISNVKINVSLKEVTVDHDGSLIIAEEINDALNRNNFDSTMKKMEQQLI